MCEVNDIGAGEAPIQEDEALERIFSECDVPSTGRASVSTLIGYMRDHMSTHGSPDILKDLRKSMCEVSYNGEVTRKQYYDVSRRWLARIRKRQHREENCQDGNNNVHIDRNSDILTDDSVGPPTNRRAESTPRIKTVGLAQPADGNHVDTPSSVSELQARIQLQGTGILDLSTSTIVDTSTRCDTPDPFFGDLSSVDGTYHMAIDDTVAETVQDLRLRAQRCTLDNDHLREELQRAEDSIAILERQLAAIGRKLELANSRCERLQREHDEHKELLAAAERDREALGARNKRLERDNYLFRKEIEAAETEIRRLNADVDRANEQKEERIRLLAHCRQALVEQQALYDEAKGNILQMELTNEQLRGKHEISSRTNEHLKVVVRELETRISELQRSQNYILHGEGLFASPPFNNELHGEVEIYQGSQKTVPCSLRDEMEATGYAETEAGRGDGIESLNETVEGRNINSGEYVDTMRYATDQLERAIAEVAVTHKELGIEMPTGESPGNAPQQLVQAAVNEKHCLSTEDFHRFNRQLRHALTILSLMASRRIANTDTKDATTQLDQVDLVPAQTAVCNIDTDSMSCANQDENNESRPTCRTWNCTRAEEEEPPLVEVTRPGVASSTPISPSVRPTDVSSTSRVTSTPRSSPRLSSPPLSPGYFCEQSIIIPIVAALDEIIQGTSDRSKSSSSSEVDDTYSPMKSRREKNPRYVHTLPSSRPLELECEMSRDPESLLSPMHKDGLESGSCVWRCHESMTTNDTSDDTYSTSSVKSQSVSSVELNRCSPALNLLESLNSTESNEVARFERTRENTIESEMCRRALASDSIYNRILSNRNDNTDVVEDLNLNLERLTLKSGIPDNNHDAAHTNFHRQGTIIGARVHSLEMIPATEHQLHSEVPKRKTSVYHRSFDYCDRLEIDQTVMATKSVSSASSVNVQKSDAATARAPVPNESLTVTSQRSKPIINPSWYSVPDDLHSKRSNLTVETCESHGSSSATLDDTTSDVESSGHQNNQAWDKKELPCPPKAYNTETVELGEYPRDDFHKLSSSRGVTTRGEITHPHGSPGVSDIPNRPSMVKPTKFEVGLGNCLTKYVISGTRSPPQPAPTLTPSLPSYDEASGGDVASADDAEWRSDGRKISARFRSVARAMSSEEDSSDSECTRDRIDREEHAQVVVAPLPLPLSSPLPLPPSSRPLSPPQTQTHTHTHTHTQTQTPTPTQIYPQPLPPQQQQASLQLSTIGLGSDFLFENPLPYRDSTSGRITRESEGNFQCQIKNLRRLRRSLSESDIGPCRRSAECRYRCRCSCSWNGARNRIICPQGNDAETAEDPKDRQSCGVFPNLPDTRLVELGLAVTSDSLDLCGRIGEDELERKYTALSIGLGTDRITLPRRLALSLRQRDQAERNLTTEVEKMQRDIQALAPLCVDRESVERVERVKHQLEMISRCALRVSCTAELLGATHQERRVSMTALLADRYLQALRARCDKLSAELAETKRILTENNIVVEENPSELIDDVVSRVRYRGVPSTNRTTMSRRRASIATISRPTIANSLQEATKDNVRQQRTSVPARMTLRRPSLGYDGQRWDEKLDRTDSSSSSIGELREIFEQAESRRSSREENNNLIHSQSSNFSVGTCESGDSDVWASTRDDPAVSFQAQARDEELTTENRSSSRRTPRVFRTLQERISSLPISWYILFVAIFFFGFYSNRYVTTRSAAPLKWWSVDEIIKRYVHVRRNVPPPV